MKKIIVLVSFKLNNKELISDWLEISNMINNELSSIDGFISRDSGVDENGCVDCIAKWESLDKQKEFRANFEQDVNFAKKMEEMARVVNMETMTQKIIELN